MKPRGTEGLTCRNALKEWAGMTRTAVWTQPCLTLALQLALVYFKSKTEDCPVSSNGQKKKKKLGTGGSHL
jgi:hypothetical protein